MFNLLCIADLDQVWPLLELSDWYPALVEEMVPRRCAYKGVAVLIGQQHFYDLNGANPPELTSWLARFYDRRGGDGL